MTIKFDKVTPQQLAEIHNIVDSAKTIERYPKGSRLHSLLGNLEDAVPYMSVTKVVWDKQTGYEVNVEIDTNVFATTEWDDGRRGRSVVLPSRNPLIQIFNVLGLMPENEKIKMECR